MNDDASIAVEHLRRSDPALKRLIDEIGPLQLEPHEGSVFAGLLRSIVHQQLSGKAATTIHGRLIAALPKRLSEHPTALVTMSDEQLRAVGLSRNKAAAVRDLAEKTIASDVPTRRKSLRMCDEELIASLVKVRGIGRWTVEMLLIFWLGRPDVLPLDDLGIQKGFAVTYGLKGLPKPERMLRQGEAWRPFRSAASWYLWRAADLSRKKLM